MPYKDIEKRRLDNKKHSSKKVEVFCNICNSKTKIRKDTFYKYKKFTCSKECKSKMISDYNKGNINEKKFIYEYLKYNCGLQTLCKKYKIGGLRGKFILDNNNIEIKSSKEMLSLLKERGLGNWKVAEYRFCKKCNQKFKYKKSATLGRFCSMLCYRKYSGKTSIEEITENLLIELGLQYESEFKVDKSFYDFYLPEQNLLIECDGGILA